LPRTATSNDEARLPLNRVVEHLDKLAIREHG
jgi:hypothetical protein